MDTFAFESRVFVSYARADHSIAQLMMEAMRHAGLSVRPYADEVSPGETVGEKLQLEIELAHCIVVLWSTAAAQSEWAQQVHQAIKAWSSNRLVLVKLDDAALPVGLRDLSVISTSGATESDTKAIIERIQANLAHKYTSARKSIPSHDKYWEVWGGRKDRSISPKSFTIMSFFFFFFTLAFAFTMIHSLLADEAPGEGLPVSLHLVVALIASVLALGTTAGAAAVWAWTARARRNGTPKAEPSSESLAMSDGHVFVSYSRQDGKSVDQLVHEIRQLGHEVWIDRRSQGSQRYAATIVRAIETSRLVALMCSQNAFASDHVIREMYVAGDYKKPFIVFQIDLTEIPGEIRYFVSGFPRIPVANLDAQLLRSEIARLVATRVR